MDQLGCLLDMKAFFLIKQTLDRKYNDNEEKRSEFNYKINEIEI